MDKGDVCNQFNFVVQSCLRMYIIEGKGNIHNIQFVAEKWWIIDIGSFHQRTPPELNIDALENIP